MQHSMERVPGTTAAFMLLVVAFGLLAGTTALFAWGLSEAAGWLLKAALGV